MNRQPGYYWVKFNEVWRAAEWAKSIYGGDEFWWHMPGFSDKDTAFSEINENRIPAPDEVGDPQLILSHNKVQKFLRRFKNYHLLDQATTKVGINGKFQVWDEKAIDGEIFILECRNDTEEVYIYKCTTTADLACK